MAHIFVSKGHGAFSPDGKVAMTPDKAIAHNAEMTRQELAHWATAPDTFGPVYYSFPTDDARKPSAYRASFYPVLGAIGTDIVTTWTGAELGFITSARVYRHNFGARMVSMRIRGNNGATYYGRASWDNGTYIKLRKVVKR